MFKRKENRTVWELVRQEEVPGASQPAFCGGGAGAVGVLEPLVSPWRAHAPLDHSLIAHSRSCSLLWVRGARAAGQFQEQAGARRGELGTEPAARRCAVLGLERGAEQEWQ